jgi:hypothetical protein
MTQRGCTSVARKLAALKNETTLAKVSGVVAELADFAASAPGATKLAVNTHRQTKVTVLGDFMFDHIPWVISDLGVME